MKLLTRFVVAVVFAITFSLAAFTQQPASPESSSVSSSTQNQQPQVAATPSVDSQDILKQEEKQRALGVVPLFGMTSVRNAPPLTAKQKFQLMGRSVIDPFTFAVVGIQAGIGQAEDSFSEYGQGAEGYGKRYGAALADSVDSNFFSNFFYPVLFRQDPRYFRLGEGSIKKRTWYAMEHEFIARQDSGRASFHFSNVLGAMTAGGISNAYYPQADRGFGLTMNRAGIALAYGSLGNLLLEFWPDIDRKLFHKHESQPHPVDLPDAPPK